ncbi:MAG: response regulator transcription factor [Melioribacteraceae bacterium]|nr:response regulator transcription factor [Melioribacteraceae bacterium]
MNILIAEDEKPIAESLKKNFLQAGHNAMIAFDGLECLNQLTKIEFDVILLDWRMPNKNGEEVCREIRESGNETPIVLLTALTDIKNKVHALNIGADDYITKPFSFDEVLARLQAVVRRYNSSVSKIDFGDLSLDLIKHHIETNEGIIKLSEKEFDLLKYFLDNKGTVLSKEEISMKIWQVPYSPNTNVIEATVKNLRKKLEENSSYKYIKTIYGEGYLFLDN